MIKLKEKLAKSIGDQIKKLPDEMKRDFMRKFYQHNKDNPEINKLLDDMKKMIGYGKDDFK